MLRCNENSVISIQGTCRTRISDFEPTRISNQDTHIWCRASQEASQDTHISDFTYSSLLSDLTFCMPEMRNA